MASDPKSNSVVGIFKQDAKPGTRESYPLIGAIPVAIEALSVEQVGNNCQWDPKPHIINATNVDTETVLGQIGIQALSTILQEQVNNVDWETISYGDIDADGLPESAGSTIKYRIISVVWIGEACNGEDDEDAFPLVPTSPYDEDTPEAERMYDGYSGMDHLLPTYIDIDFNQLDIPGAKYLLRYSTVGASCSIFGFGARSNYYGNSPRSFLVLAFPIIMLTASSQPLGYTRNGFTGIAEISFDTSAESLSVPLNASMKEVLLPARIREHNEIFDIDETVVYPVVIAVTDIGSYKRITASSYNPALPSIYYTIVYENDPNYATFTADAVTSDSPGTAMATNNFQVDVYRSCKVVLCQRLSIDTIEKSELVEVTIAFDVAIPPIIRFWETWDGATGFDNEITGEGLPPTIPFYISLERDEGCSVDELANTAMAWGVNNYGTYHYLFLGGNLYLEYGDGCTYGDHNPFYVSVADQTGEVANIYVQTIPVTSPDETLDQYQASEVLQYEGLVESGGLNLPMPVVIPPYGTHYNDQPETWPRLYVDVTSDLVGVTGLAIRYAWRKADITMDPDEGLETADFLEGTGWDVIRTISISSGSGPFRVFQDPVAAGSAVGNATVADCPGASADANVLYICFTKTGWTSPVENIGVYTYTFLPAVPRLLEEVTAEPLADGFDNKLVVKKLETYDVIHKVLRFTISPTTVPAVNASYDESMDEVLSPDYGGEHWIQTTLAEKMYYSGNLPAFSQTFLVTPTGITRDSIVLTRRSCILTMAARHRKQLSTYLPNTASDMLDVYKEKKKFCLYSSEEAKIYLNLYSDAFLDSFRYCFSIVNLLDNTETFPNNFSSDPIASLYEPKIFVSRIQVLDELASGLFRAVITYSIGETTAESYGTKNFIAYLELSYLSDYYPALSSCTYEPNILNEVIVDADTMEPSCMFSPLSSMQQQALGFPLQTTLPLVGNTNRYFKRVINERYNPSRVISARLFVGNSMALGERTPVRFKKKYFDMLFSYGGHSFMWNDYHCSQAHLPWSDGIERYAQVTCFPVVFPVNAKRSDDKPLMLYPEVGYSYAYYCGGSGTLANTPWENHDPDALRNNNPLSYSEAYYMRYFYDELLTWASKMIAPNGEPCTGTLMCIQPPAILPGGAYNATGLALTELNLEVIKKKLVYGDEVGPATLSSNAGIFSLSNWPYMSDNSRRLSQIGVTAQSMVLENYIFSIENGYACVYFINEQQGKNLLFNELGKFLDFPVIFRGVPYFGISNHNGIIIYCLILSNRLGARTQEGVNAIRKFPQETQGVMFHISGHNPSLFIKKTDTYESWAIDTNAVYKTGTFPFSQLAEIRRISSPTGTTAILVTEQNEHIIEHKHNDNMSIESSEIYPSMLSYEYEQYTFVVNKVVLRFDVQEIQPAGPVKRTSSGRNPNTQVFNISVKANNDTILYAQTEVKALSETIICLDATPVKSLSYTITSKVPVRSVRFTGHFIEDLKVE
jgi:hypothetical protein